MSRSGGCLIIDDVDEALSKMTPLGREISCAPARTIREVVVGYATRRGWSILRYRAYADWAVEKMSGDARTWLVLDPLFPLADLPSRIRSVRLTRRFHDNQAIVDRRQIMDDGGTSIEMSGLAGEIGVVDDAAASGSTLRYIARLVGQAGASVSQVLVSASSRGARDSFRTFAQTARWAEFVRGDWEIVHLRDGCPHLPYSGRPTVHPSIAGVDGGSIEIRVPSSSVLGNLWQVLTMDTKIRHTVMAAHSEIVRAFSSALGRPACVRDLSLMGPFVPVLAKNGESVTSDATLESLLELPSATA